MKFLKLFSLAILSAFVITSCEKEYSLEDNPILAKGSLKADGFAECLPSTVAGIYKADSTLGTGNFIEVQVNVTSTGAYEIYSDTVNGYFFDAFGAFNTTGLQTVRMLGHGKPLLEGTNEFLVRFDSSECYISVNVLSSSALLASFTLTGAPGLCANASTAGTYTQGVALTAANTLSLDVNVTAPGAYTIGAASTNGMIFTAAGTFTTLGTQTVVLTGSGTPTTSGDIPITAGNFGGTCTYTIAVAPGTGGGGTNTWSFNKGATVFSGTTEDALLLSVFGLNTLTIAGTNPGNQTILITLTNLAGPIGTGAYSGTSSTGRFATFQFTDGMVTYTGVPGVPNNSLAVNITLFDTTNHRVEGTFAGNVSEGAVIHGLTSGSFKANMP